MYWSYYVVVLTSLIGNNLVNALNITDVFNNLEDNNGTSLTDQTNRPELSPDISELEVSNRLNFNVNASYPSGNFSIFEEIRLLSRPPTSSRSGELQCSDNYPYDCPSWVNSYPSYCHHENSVRREWIRENCRKSCKICMAKEVPKNPNSTCQDQRVCKHLYRYCEGPYQSHVKKWCRRTCGLCNDTKEPKNTSGSTLTASADGNSTLNNSTEIDQVCFPTNCGIIPVSAAGPRLRFKRRSYIRPPPRILLKILGGSQSRKGEWPWHGLLNQMANRRVRYCGITIICQHWLVTAAHCVLLEEHGLSTDRRLINTLTLYVGRNEGHYNPIHDASQMFDRRDIERVIVHPKFRTLPIFSNDIALIKLRQTSPIHYNHYVQPICLSQLNNLREGDMMTTYGWGDTKGIGPAPFTLKHVRVPFVSHKKCWAREILLGLKREGRICAGGKANSGTCNGDSGGSLVLERVINGTLPSRFVFYGITSYGNQHCNSRPPYEPGIYTDVTYHYNWIKEQTNGCCVKAQETSRIQSDVLITGTPLTSYRHIHGMSSE